MIWNKYKIFGYLIIFSFISNSLGGPVVNTFTMSYPSIEDDNQIITISSQTEVGYVFQDQTVTAYCESNVNDQTIEFKQEPHDSPKAQKNYNGACSPLVTGYTPSCEPGGPNMNGHGYWLKVEFTASTASDGEYMCSVSTSRMFRNISTLVPVESECYKDFKSLEDKGTRLLDTTPAQGTAEKVIYVTCISTCGTFTADNIKMDGPSITKTDVQAGLSSGLKTCAGSLTYAMASYTISIADIEPVTKEYTFSITVGPAGNQKVHNVLFKFYSEQAAGGIAGGILLGILIIGCSIFGAFAIKNCVIKAKANKVAIAEMKKDVPVIA